MNYISEIFICSPFVNLHSVGVCVIFPLLQHHQCYGTISASTPAPTPSPAPSLAPSCVHTQATSAHVTRTHARMHAYLHAHARARTHTCPPCAYAWWLQVFMYFFEHKMLAISAIELSNKQPLGVCHARCVCYMCVCVCVIYESCLGLQYRYTRYICVTRLRVHDGGDGGDGGFSAGYHTSLMRIDMCDHT